ncbi:MAG: alpha/beta hydrolase [Rhodocyclaceae bacterium]|nr:MAG: alpha/beta hydrolase [Rhodocyclaceae bacterium]
MNPIRFGPPGRQLFAMYHPPTTEARGEGVLMCNPFGQEAIRCHRLFRVLADQLARQGFHALRFDYFATGDSAGDDGEGDLDGWCRDVLAADEDLRLRSGCKSVSWFGLRLGASIASLAVARSRYPVQHLILWDPVIDGNNYLDELAAAHLRARRESFGARWSFDARLINMAQREIQDEALGFLLPQRLREQFATISAAALTAGRPDAVAILAGPGLAGLEADLMQRWVAGGTPVTTTAVTTTIDWTSNEAMNSSIVPLDVLQSAVALLKDSR